MREYLNTMTGEVLATKNIFKAWAYFSRDSKSVGYPFKLRYIISMKTYYKKALK